MLKMKLISVMIIEWAPSIFPDPEFWSTSPKLCKNWGPVSTRSTPPGGEDLKKSHKHYLLAATCALVLLSDGRPASGQAAAPTIPLVPGLTIVVAAHDTPPAGAPEARSSKTSHRETLNSS
jgi:hypothetical protein